MKKRLLMMIVATILILACGCSNKVVVKELMIGKYVEMENGLAWVILKENSEFILNRHIATSYAPVGKYSIQDDRLILKVNDNEKYEFKVDGDRLIFEKGTYVGDLIKEGAVFQFTDRDE